MEAANTAIQQAFAVGLTLASCAQMVNGPAAERPAAALDALDAIIAGLRSAALGQFSAGVEAAAALIDGQAGETNIDQIIDRLLAVAGDISDSCAAPSADRRRGDPGSRRPPPPLPCPD